MSESSESTWSPEQYARFAGERSRPFFDLLSLVRPRAAMRVVDLGCGPGELTRAMHERLGARETVGVDSSDTMLAKAASHAGGGLRFERATIEQYVAPDEARAPFDLVLSNAALHWVDDHAALLPRLAAMVGPAGQLAVQIPSNHDHLSHVTANEVAREAPFAGALAGYQRVFPNATLDEYATWLDALGFVEQHVRMQVYGHRLGSRVDVVEWVKGSLLTDFQKRMPPELWPRYLARYTELLVGRLEDRRPFFFPFKRTLMWATR